MAEDFVDPYIDPDTGILYNLVGATTYDELGVAEADLVTARECSLLDGRTPHVTGTLDDLARIHRWLFQDVYPWAGRTRTVEIRKNVEGSQFFLPSPNIETGIAWAHGELEKDGLLRGMGQVAFVRRLAYHYDNYNFVHPFREGNGRTQRLMWSLICHDAGFDLDWRLASGAENDEASRLATEDRDYGALVAMFSRLAAPCDPRLPLSVKKTATGHLRH